MTIHDSRCTLICCTFDRERANAAPGRRNLRPMFSPAAATRDAAAGDSTSSVCHGDSAPEPVGRLGGVVTLDPTSGAVAGEVQAAPDLGGAL